MEKTMHMIGNAHLDPVWLWNWKEGFQENKATLKSALDRMDEFDDFIFTSSSAQFYEWVEENAPELFARIQERVRQGRWVICGGWWVQPDCNLPCGESFVRQALLGQNYFLEKFGVQAKTGYCVDSFGHNAMLPQLLRKSGMEHYIFMRPGPAEKELPGRVFWWEAPDGSRVKAFRIPYSYSAFEDLEERVDQCAQEFSPGIDHMMCFYGVGNHGGGPTLSNLNKIRRMNAQRTDLRVIMSDPEHYFQAIAGCELPVVRDDLQHHAPGCYSVVTMIKAMNRRAENALLAAEKFSAVAGALGLPTLTQGLERGWKNVLFNQFHDILAGSSLEEAYQDARNELGESIAIAERCTNQAVQAISFAVDIPLNTDTLPLMIFNPHSWSIRVPVEFEKGLFHDDELFEALSITDSEGRTVPHQYLTPVCHVPNRKRFTFLAEVPALGYATYFANHVEREPQSAGNCEPFQMENEILSVRLDQTMGTIASIVDKRTGKELLAAACKVSVIEDRTDTWGHTLKRLDQEVGTFRMISSRVMDSGAVRKAISVTSAFGASTLVQTFALYAGEDKVRVTAKLNWQDHCKAVKLRFPLCLQGAVASCEIPFGHIEKEQNGLEEPMQRWADLSAPGAGLSILNDSKYGVDFADNTIGITVLRSPAYAQHDPYELDAEEEYTYVDQGIHTFSYHLKAHSGDWRTAGTVRDAALLNRPPVTLFETFHKGTLPLRRSFLQIDSEHVLASALKEAYDGNGVILRLYESAGKAERVTITLFGRSLSVSFAPYEIKTLRLNRETWEEVNLIEQSGMGVK